MLRSAFFGHKICGSCTPMSPHWPLAQHLPQGVCKPRPLGMLLFYPPHHLVVQDLQHLWRPVTTTLGHADVDPKHALVTRRVDACLLNGVAHHLCVP